MTQTAVPSLYPALRYHDARAAIDWLCRAFGFSRHVVFDAPDGSVGHAELQMGTAVVGLSSVGPVAAANPWTAVSQGLYLCVTEVDALHDRAKAAGADVVMPLADQSYGSRDFSVRDPGGFLWSFGTYREGSGEAGEATLFPCLHYDDGPAALRFLNAAFGFTPGLVVPGPGTSIMHSELHRGADTLMLSSTPKDDALWNKHSQGTCVLVADPDAHFSRARDAGAVMVRSIEDTPYGARGYSARDPEGFMWHFSNYKPSA
jgi:uncharacterized glyoxalase superfamily protein PhnB